MLYFPVSIQKNRYTQNTWTYTHLIPKCCVFLWITTVRRGKGTESCPVVPHRIAFGGGAAPFERAAGRLNLENVAIIRRAGIAEKRPQKRPGCARKNTVYLSKNTVNLSIFIELFRNDKPGFRRPAPVLMTLFPTWPDSAIGDSSNGLPPGGDPRFRERRPRVEQGNGAPAQNALLRGNARFPAATGRRGSGVGMIKGSPRRALAADLIGERAAHAAAEDIRPESRTEGIRSVME